MNHIYCVINHVNMNLSVRIEKTKKIDDYAVNYLLLCVQQKYDTYINFVDIYFLTVQLRI